MSDQLDLFAGTEFEPKPKPKKVRPKDIRLEKPKDGVAPSWWSENDEKRIMAFIERWKDACMYSDLLKKDLLKFDQSGNEILPMYVARYHELIRQVMRVNHINAKHYEVEGYGTGKLGIVRHDGEECIKFNHRETNESIYIKV